ncbi:28806_t:CDS:1, partial [Gigaspora margarita]
PVLENTSSEESNNEIYKKPMYKKTKLSHKSGSKKQSWVWNYFKSENVIETSE